jgi:glycerophosphoryl diester phosphodiesterase
MGKQTPQRRMRVIIAGSRSFDDFTTMSTVMGRLRALHGVLPTTILSGGARGADQLGERWAATRNIPVEHFPADWDRYGRSAGPRRNIEMLESGADLVVCFWDGVSRGSQHLMQAAHDRGIQVMCYRFSNPVVEK